MNVPQTKPIMHGYSLVYNMTYSWPSVNTEINTVRSQCRSSSSLCVAGGDMNGKILLMACANCFDATAVTNSLEPALSAGVWWYNTPGLSFGFAPAWQITQNPTDTTVVGGENRLSWDLTTTSGGFRLGTLTALNSSTIYRKLIYLYF